MTEKSKIQDKNPFRVPDNYFSEVSKKVYERTSGPETEKDKPRVMDMLRPFLMLAAAMLAFAVISYTGLRFLFPERYGSTDAYFTGLVYQIDEVQLIDRLTEESGDIDRISAGSEEIIDYLIDSDVENESIIELLN